MWCLLCGVKRKTGRTPRHSKTTPVGMGGDWGGKQKFCFYFISLLTISNLGVADEKRTRYLTCYLSLDFTLSCCVSINQRFAIKLNHQCSEPSQVIKYELINFLLICMIIKIPTFNSVNCPPTRRLIGLC